MKTSCVIIESSAALYHLLCPIRSFIVKNILIGRDKIMKDDDKTREVKNYSSFFFFNLIENFEITMLKLVNK